MEIPATMQAVQIDQPGEPLVLNTVPVPDVGPRDVLVRVAAVGLNGGDIHLAIEGSIPLYTRPLTLGHEIAGTVVAVGSEAGRLEVGDRVHCDPTMSCLTCENCMSGARMACGSSGVIGMAYFGYTEHGLDRYMRYAHGACAEFIRMPEENVEPLSDETPFDVACKFGVLGTGYRAVKTARVEPHHTVIVNPATGGTGAATVLCAHFAGARQVIAIGRSRSALDQIKEKLDVPFETICTSEEEPGARVTELTDGLGADSLIDFTPTEADLTSRLIAYVKSGGRAVLGGGTVASVEVDYRTIMAKAVSILGTHAYTQTDIRELDRLVAEGRIRVDQLITHRFPLAETNAALQMMSRREGHPLWVVIEPQA